jgi:phosphoadenosine phosphosulfate reductase
MSTFNLAAINQKLAELTAQQRIAFALEHFPSEFVASSSFGAQSAAFLHVLQSVQANIPVVLVDTLFLFEQTYAFVNLLQERLRLNLIRVTPESTERWNENAVQNLEVLGLDAINRYNQAHKVRPMQKALADLKCGTWLVGMRRSSAQTRTSLPFVSLQNSLIKVHPLADWSDRDVGRYLTQHNLPYHPLWEQGYVSIGDRFLTQAHVPGMDADQTRFFGLKRECGLHETAAADVDPRFSGFAISR